MRDPSEIRNKMACINLRFAKAAVPTISKRATKFGLKVAKSNGRLQIIENSILKLFFLIIIANQG